MAVKILMFHKWAIKEVRILVQSNVVEVVKMIDNLNLAEKQITSDNQDFIHSPFFTEYFSTI